MFILYIILAVGNFALGTYNDYEAQKTGKNYKYLFFFACYLWGIFWSFMTYFSLLEVFA